MEPVLNIDGPALHSPWPHTRGDPRFGMVYPPLQTSFANGRQVTVSQGGGDCKGISRQAVVPSTDEIKEKMCEVTFALMPICFIQQKCFGPSHTHTTPLEREYHRKHTCARFEEMGKHCKAMRKADGQHKPAQYMLTTKIWK